MTEDPPQPVGPGDPPALPERHQAMAARVLREAGNRGVRGIEDHENGVLGRALELAMAPRLALLADDHHPAYLHPGRTVIILLQDTPERDPTLLAAAALVESDQAVLRVALQEIQDVVGQGVVDVVDQVPRLPGDEVLERLLGVPPEVARLALAERLDHLRHLHLDEDMARRRRMHREAQEIYAPLAHRVDAVLARRYDWWCRMFARRHLPGE